MSKLNPVDKVIIEQLKKKAEIISGQGDSANWLQKDYEYLIFLIENETGQRLSLSTIKRLWNNQYERLPHLYTLNALAQYSFNKDWLSLKKEYNPQISVKSKKKLPFFFKNGKLILVLTIAVLIGSLVSHFLFRNDKTENIGNTKSRAYFICEKPGDEKLPVSVDFRYNLKNIDAGVFYIQQSWDEARKIKVDKNNTSQDDIYYTPGFFWARLIADNEVIAWTNVHITNKDWIIAARQHPTEILEIPKEACFNEHYLGVKPEVLVKYGVNLNKGFQLNYYNSKEFNVDGDNFSYHTSFKMDSLNYNSCPGLLLIIKGEYDLLRLNFCKKGCENNIEISFSELTFNGVIKDLSLFGIDIYQWQNILVRVINKNLVISLNEKTIFECAYTEPIGNIKSINYYFNGIGAIDNVELKNSKEEIKFYDNF